jgi:hypothetical protein
MAAPTARIDKGTFTDSPCTQEANLLIESVEMTGSRDKKYWKDITTGADVLRRDENPKCKWDIKGWVKSVNGFVTQHVGTTVSTLANFASTFAGFDPAVGIMTYVDPKHSWSIQELRKLDFSVEHDPFIA